jgi:hypothetical protein
VPSSRTALGVVVAILAVFVGVCAGWVSRGVWRPGSVVLPWGLALAIVGSSSGVLLARSIGRRHGFVAGAGWIVGVFALMARSDTIIAGDWLGYAFLLGATATVIASAVWGRGLA